MRLVVYAKKQIWQILSIAIVIMDFGHRMYNLLIFLVKMHFANL